MLRDSATSDVRRLPARTGAGRVPSDRFAVVQGSTAGNRTWICLLALIGCVAAFGVAWLIRFRVGQVTGWDESGYLAISFRDATALRDGGPFSLVKQFELQGLQAPLLPLTTAPIGAIFGNGVLQSLLALQVFLACLVALSYSLARTVLGRGWSLVAAASVGTTPAIIDFSRLYVFVVPATVFLTASVWALIKSDGLRHRRWVVAAGALAGLMLLSRTMSLTFLPGSAVAAAGLLLASPPEDRRRRAKSLIAAAITTVAVAGTWYFRNLISVGAYLVNYGYGNQSTSFGAAHSPSSWGYWAKDIRLGVESYYLPLAALIALGLVMAVARRTRARPFRQQLGTPAFVLTTVTTVGYLVLTSSSNEGSGFVVPLLPSLTVLAVAGVATIREQRVRNALAVLFLAVSATNIVMKSARFPFLTEPSTVAVPGLGTVPVVDGRGLIQVEVARAGYPVEPLTAPMPDLDKRWLPTMRQLIGFAAHYASARNQAAYVLFGSDDTIFTSTRADFASALWFGGGVRVGSMPIASGADSVRYYRARLEGIGPNFVEVDATRGGPVRITPRYVEAAASSVGYRRVYLFTLPDGRTASMWYRPQSALRRTREPRSRAGNRVLPGLQSVSQAG